jgi:glycerate kinase
VAVGSREIRALGDESAYGIADRVGRAGGGDGGGSAAERLSGLAERVARTWSWSR